MNMKILEDAVKLGLIPKEVVDNMKHRKCPLCGADTSNPVFKDKLSEKEFNISGMCPDCQDKVFGGEDE